MTLDQVFDVLRQPASELLASYGIKTKINDKWLNMSWCPWCGHGKEGKNGGDNYQCGVTETQGAKGYLHAVRCMHPHHSPTGEASPHYADFLVELGALTRAEADQAKNVSSALTQATFVRQVASIQVGRMNEENNAKARRRLVENSAAIEYLSKRRGYTLKTIERFRLGLSEPYEKDGVRIHAYALAAPLVGIDGNFYKKYVNYAIPGVTVDNRERKQKAWSPGNARAYYNGNITSKPWLFVCDGLKDLWALDQLIRGTPLADKLALVSSTNGGGGLPDEWKHPEYWERFEHVFAGHDNDKADPLSGKRAGDEHAKAVTRSACRDVMRVTPPGVKDWNDWTLAGHTADELRVLLEEAEPVQVVEPWGEDTGTAIGRFAADPVSVVGEYHNGYLYEAVRTLVRERSEANGEMVEYYNTIVIRSDRTQHRALRMPAPKGTADHNSVWRLVPDGTLLSRLPEPNPNLTWGWPAIKSWLDKKDKTPELKVLLTRIQNHLRGSMWLPYEQDFSILACAVVASYVQEVFDAVPLLLVTGPAGSGKSELGEALRGIGANSRNVLARVSAATLARHIDATRGLVIIDDLEQIGGNSGKDAQFDDLVQTLKLSYKKTTAMKMVTEFKNGVAHQREFNFFGIKIINNTRGSDDILGSRMLTISTRHMPKVVKLDKTLKLSPESLLDTRNQLHTWAFNNVKAVSEAYLSIFPNKTGRQEEIEAPLRVIAALSGDESIAVALEKALDRQKSVSVDQFSPEEVMREALESIFRRSIERSGVIPTWITVTQVMMEMANLVDANYGKDFTTSLASIEKPEWVGRTLLQRFVDPDAPRQRTSMYGKGMRAYRLTDELIEAMMVKIADETPSISVEKLARTDNFKLFCQACSGCPYTQRCDMQKSRIQENASHD